MEAALGKAAESPNPDSSLEAQASLNGVAKAAKSRSDQGKLRPYEDESDSPQYHEDELTPADGQFDDPHDGDRQDSNDEEGAEPELSMSADSLTTDSVQRIMDMSGKYKLLNAAEEVQHAKAIEHGLFAAAQLERLPDPDSKKLKLSPEERGKLLQQIKELGTKKRSGEQSKEVMINSNLRLVISIAKKYQGQGVAFDDLIEEGIVGLSRAVEKFDWRMGYKLSTYATWWIRQACQRVVANQQSTIRIPVHVRERIQKIRKKRWELTSKLQHDPSPNEIREFMIKGGMNPDHFDDAWAAMSQRIDSLDEPLDKSDPEATKMDLYIEKDDEHEQTVEEEALQNLDHDELMRAIDELPAVQKQVIEMRFGLNGQVIKTLDEIGHEMDCTREWIRQLEKKAFRHLAAHRGLREVVFGN